MKVCRAVCSCGFYVFGACLFSWCVSELFFFLYFLFSFFSPSCSGKEICEEGESVPRARGRAVLTGWVKKGLLSGNPLSPGELGRWVVNAEAAEARADSSITTWNGLETADHWGNGDLIRRVSGVTGSQFALPSFSCHGPALEEI